MSTGVGVRIRQYTLDCNRVIVYKNDKIKLEKLLKSCLEQEDEVQIMGSLAHHWYSEGKEEGKAEGIEQGIEKTAINMLKQDLDIELISKVTGLSMLQVQKLKAKL